MPRTVRSLTRKLFVLALVVVATGVGYSVRNDDTPRTATPHTRTRHAKKLGLSDLILIANQATGIHLRIPGITTGALTPDHANDIPISSFQLGVSRAIGAPTGTRAVDKAAVSEVTLSRSTDSWSVKLLNSALRGTATATAPNATIYFTDTSGPAGALNDYLQVDLRATLLSQYSLSSGGSTPSESLSLNFTKLTFTAHIPAGTTQTVSYDMVTQS